MIDYYKQAILDANKLGHDGYRVVEIIEPDSATDSQRVKFLVDQPLPETASESIDW